MFIDVTDIRKSSGLSINVQDDFDIKSMETGQDVVEFDQPLAVVLTLKNIEGLFELKGTVEGDTKLICNRCLEPYPFHLKAYIDELFANSSTVGSLGEKGIDSDDVHVFEGNRIELDESLLEALLLEMPMKALCSEECQGLCSVCGTNLNTGKCSCDKTSIDPRMEVLKNLLK